MSIRFKLLRLVLAAPFLGLAGCAPTVDFSADTTGGTQPLKVTFTDRSSTLGPLRVSYNSLFPVYGWEWDFGDNTGSTAENPVKTYEVAGDYDISLSVSNFFGESTVTKPDFIKVQLPASTPTSRFSFSVNTTDPLTIVFKDESTEGSRPITQWLWDFGDNRTSTEQNPTHTYAAAGIYKVTLRVTTVVGSNNSEKTVPVAQSNPAAEFRAQPDASNSFIIIFTDESTPGSQPITKWEWTFGDGGISSEQNPRHTYTAAGTFNVKLKVTTGAGTSEKTESVTVVAAPPATTEGEGE